MWWRAVTYVLCALTVVVPGPSSVLDEKAEKDNGQQVRVRADTTEGLEKAVRLVETKKYGEAIRRLEALFEEKPSRTYQYGSVAYWLGKAYMERGDRRKALTAWREGAALFRERQNRFDYLLADAYVRAAFQGEGSEDRNLASEVYRSLIRRAAEYQDLCGKEREVLRRHLHDLALILPSQVQAQTGLTVDRRTMTVRVDPAREAGSILEQWWRRQDPLPATRTNERLFEHLRRSSVARDRYSHEGVLDDRGKVFVRLGEPSESASVGMEDNARVSSIATEIRRNEFWVYGQVDRSAHFLFVEVDPDEYRIAGVDDIFPPDMTTGIAGPTERASEQARNYLYTLENVVRELGTFHEAYVDLASDVFDRAAWARDNDQFGIGPDPVEGTVGDFLQSTESKMVALERKNAQRRIQNVPQSHSAVAERLPNLPVASRTARYLTEKGETRVEIYWSLPVSRMKKSPEAKEQQQFILSTVVVRRNAEQERQATRKRRYEVCPSARPGAILTPNVFEITTADSLFYLDAQWDQYTDRGGEGKKGQVGPSLSRHTEHFGAFEALRSDPETLEMSDIKLLTVPAESSQSAVTSQEGIPYPFDRVRSSQTLALSFEIYHLDLGKDGRSDYSISYATEQTSETGETIRFLEEGQKTKAQTTYQGSSASSTEYVLLDTKNLVDDAPRDVSVIVTVTDRKKWLPLPCLPSLA